MKPGDLDRRITLTQPGGATGTNDFNEPVYGEGTALTVWAKRVDVSDSERFAAGQVGALVHTRFVIRSTTQTRALTARATISDGDQAFNITGIKETQDGRNRFLEITAVREAD